MEKEAILDYYIYNGERYLTSNQRPFEGIQQASIYEVIRIIDGVPLYLEAHLDRMRKSAKLLGYEVRKKDEDIIEEISQLVRLNRYENINVKLICSGLDREEQDFFTFFIASKYPERRVYEEGIHTILFHTERENPNAKVINKSLREKINKTIGDAKAYEALLVNEEDLITEGSRSNIFFVKGNKVFTAPSGKVLMGITRTQIIDICRNLDIQLEEEAIGVRQLPSMDGAFMTGTSVNVLPIASIGETCYTSVDNPIVKRIGAKYEEDLREYIERNKKA